MKAKKGDFVTVHNIVLEKEQRSSNLPEDTKCVPLQMWVKGFIKDDASVGELVEITTITGRCVQGKLEEVNPYYTHNYGKFVPELLQIGIQARDILFGGEDNE